MAALPPWRDPDHFSAALSMTFSDATKWEDMSKVKIGFIYNKSIFIFISIDVVICLS